jgi:hypothetical protein
MTLSSLSFGNGVYFGMPDSLRTFDGTNLSTVNAPNGTFFNDINGLALWNGDLMVGGAISSNQGTVNQLVRIRTAGTSQIEINRALGNLPAPQTGVFGLQEFQSRLVVSGEIREFGAGLAGPNIGMYGATDSTQTVIHSVAAAPTGQATVVTVRVHANLAPTAGAVMIDGAPSGACVDTSLSVLNATTSEASCSITYLRGGAQQLTARYTGAALGAQSWQGSQSAPLAISVLQDFIFADGFE